MLYETPSEYYFRLHHVRPRFKNDVENVLLFMANEISKIPKLPNKEFKTQLNNAIRLFPSNAIIAQKTVDNWRTEISALFGFIEEDNHEKVSWAGKIALKLAKEQDLVQFFKYFLFYFQYPGGHQKHHRVMELIRTGIRFKPAQYILKLLEDGEKTTGKRFGIDKAELTHLVFNDLRVTRGSRDSKEIVNQILKNRDEKITYNWKGDVIRYAGDIIDYMLIANLLTAHGNTYYINWGEREAITAFIQSTTYFDAYNSHYENPVLQELRSLEDNWFQYVNTELGEELFKTDVLQYLGIEKDAYEIIVDNSIGELESLILKEKFENTKEIGDLGENLIIGHECMRLKLGNREDLIHLVKKIPTAFAIGYDIKSVELNELQRLIEVKTTISNKPLNFYNFHLTPNEWNTAESFGDRYFVYRLMLNKFEKKLFIIQNPVNQYKKDNLKMSPRDGADVVFNEKTGHWENLLLWKK